MVNVDNRGNPKDPRSSNSTLYFIVGALVIAVLIIGWVMYGGEEAPPEPAATTTTEPAATETATTEPPAKTQEPANQKSEPTVIISPVDEMNKQPQEDTKDAAKQKTNKKGKKIAKNKKQ